MITKELSKELIDTADFNSAIGMGAIINQTYIANLETIRGYELSDEEMQTAADTLFSFSEKELQLYRTSYPSISVAGPARYNAKRGSNAADAEVAAAQETRNFMEKLRQEQAAKNRKAANIRLVEAFQLAAKNKEKEFSCDGKDYVVRGRTRFIEKKYVFA